MSSLNKIVMLGRCVDDADSKATTEGTSMTKFTLVTERPSRNDGIPSAVDAIPCVAWRDTADVCAGFQKGQLVLAEGRVITRQYDDQDGRRHYVTEVEVREAKLVDSTKQAIENPDMQVIEQDPTPPSEEPTLEVKKSSVKEDDFDFTPATDKDAASDLDGELEESIPF